MWVGARRSGLKLVKNLRWTQWCLGAGAALVFSISGAVAQSVSGKAPDADLSRVGKIRVTASQITPDAVACGLSLSDAIPLIERELQAGGLRVVVEPRNLVTLSLMTTHDKARGICASTAMLGAYELASYFDSEEGWTRTGYVVLWQRGNQVISPVADHPEVVERTITRLSRLLLDGRRLARETAKNGKN